MLAQTTQSLYIPGIVSCLDTAIVVALAVLAASTEASLDVIKDVISATDAKEDGLGNGVLVDVVDLRGVPGGLNNLLVVVTCNLLERDQNDWSPDVKGSILPMLIRV